MATTCRICLVPGCGDEATHVLLTYTSLHGEGWPRTATLATGTLVPYYCLPHAQEKARQHGCAPR